MAEFIIQKISKKMIPDKKESAPDAVSPNPDLKSFRSKSKRCKQQSRTKVTRSSCSNLSKMTHHARFLTTTTSASALMAYASFTSRN